jgi:hypothetical protein
MNAPEVRIDRRYVRQVLWMILAATVNLLAAPTSVLAETSPSGICSSTARVSWVAEWQTATVEAAIVEVPGCADGEAIGIQLLTEHGDLPGDGPLMTEVANESARFDFSHAAVRIEPVTGVRVFLELRGDEQYVWQITVERRFFNPAGSEQMGLRDLTILQIPHDGSYRVEGAPSRYRVTACADLGYRPDDRIAEGSGVFEDVIEGGRHVVCFQQVTPGRGQGGVTEVLHGPLERDPDDRTDVLGTSHERPAPSSTAGRLGRLAMTGNDLLLAASVGFATVGVGLGLLRRRRA